MVDQMTGHLDEDRIIGAIIDEAGLDSAARRHLIECADCRAQREVLEGKLALFGQLSREQAPVPMRRVRSAEGEAKRFRPAWRIHPSFGMGFAVAAFLAILLSPHFYKHPKEINLEKIYLEMAADEKFMSEIERLEENVLPRFYMDIISDSSDDTPDEAANGGSNGGQGGKLT